jgi:hypothetical protein
MMTQTTMESKLLACGDAIAAAKIRFHYSNRQRKPKRTWTVNEPKDLENFVRKHQGRKAANII